MKTPHNVDLPLLKRLIKEVEGNGPLANQSLLYKEVAARYNNVLRDITLGTSNERLVGGIFLPLTPAIVCLRIKECGIKIKTQPGKRGRPKGVRSIQPDGTPVKRVKRSEKFANDPLIARPLLEIQKELHEKPKWYEKIAGGSMKAAVVAKCFLCSGWSVTEMKLCNILSCPLYPFLNRKSDELEE